MRNTKGNADASARNAEVKGEVQFQKDTQTQQQLQKETMALFQTYGVNPLAGCFPILIQMPILIGIFHAITRTSEIANNSFLWFDLGARDPLFILPVVAGITTFIQQKMMMAGNVNQNPQMAMMLWVMPIMHCRFLQSIFQPPLSLYWVVENLFMIIQTYFIKGPDLKQANIEGVKK